MDTKTRICVLLTCGRGATKAAGDKRERILIGGKLKAISKVTTLVSRLISEVVAEMLEEERKLLLHQTQI